MGSHLILLLCLGLVCWIIWQTRHFSKLEAEYRQRERQLIDRLLRQAKVAPLEVNREQVVSLPDPEIPPRTPQDEAFRLDDILEDLEQLRPEARGMTPEAAREQFPLEWHNLEIRWDNDHTPLRV